MADMNIEPSKLAKFKVLVSKIETKLHDDYTRYYLALSFLDLVFWDKNETESFKHMNDYATTIRELFSIKTGFWGRSKRVTGPTDVQEWINRSVKHIEGTNIAVNGGPFNGGPFKYVAPYTYYSVFWSLMILAVDDTDKEKHLSTICDFARMLDVSDEEMMDLVNVVKYVFQDATYQKPKTNEVAEFFSEVLTMYER